MLFEDSLLKIVSEAISLDTIVMGTINQDSQFDFSYGEKTSNCIRMEIYTEV